jgi:hypothetical protein
MVIKAAFSCCQVSPIVGAPQSGSELSSMDSSRETATHSIR